MPEGPEVRRYMDVVGNLKGWEVTGYELMGNKFLQQDSELWDDLMGCKLVETQTYGKVFALKFEPDMALLGHLAMTGSFLIDDHIWNHDHTRMALCFERDGDQLWLNYIDMRGWGNLEPMLHEDVPHHKRVTKLGPDALVPFRELNVDKVYENMMSHPNWTLSEALMDQTVVAGVGNIYRCEILNMSYVHPSILIKNIPEKKLRQIIESIPVVLMSAYKHGKDFTRRIYKADHCWVCHKLKRTDTVEKVKQSGRTVWYCNSCQKPERFPDLEEDV
jgi:formamidopyrimidine-DNA glycosylase